MRNIIEWNQREEVDWLQYTVQPPLGIMTGDYYIAAKEFGGTDQVSGHKGRLEVVCKDGKILFAEFNEIAMEAYYNQYFSNQDKRRSDYGIWQSSKPRQAKAGCVLADGMLHVEAQIMERQSLEGDFELLTGASGSMKNMLPMAWELAEAIKKPSEKKFYGIAEDFGYGITGWLHVILTEGRIVSCHYDEVFADHQKEIRFPELKRYYKQSKYNSPCYQDPFPRGWDRHAWNINFRTLMDLLEKRVVKTQCLLDLDGLPYTEGENQGPMWDADQPYDDPVTNSAAVRYPSYDNYLRLARKLLTVLPAGFAGKEGPKDYE
ncbi:MAG TPA: FMN-binding protein [Candidatus Hungatella pullicola]|nr:FMN-binding protein [Candidatus Hungatella pullicola]